jgi:hypothetical protein
MFISFLPTALLLNVGFLLLYYGFSTNDDCSILVIVIVETITSPFFLFVEI